ncbi:hypothetical protein DFH11DRAFT_1722346 [Phellopilus nigrolimitatus]|nr:hypothetical protein DFH11DRAFT_1722346 [Phellopilus nigrolimitatus]
MSEDQGHLRFRGACEIEPGQPFVGMLSERETTEKEKLRDQPAGARPAMQGFGIGFFMDMAVFPAY